MMAFILSQKESDMFYFGLDEKSQSEYELN